MPDRGPRDVEVEIAPPARWAVLRDLRLRALQDTPDAFGSTFEQERRFTADDWRRRVQRADRPTLLAWLGPPPPTTVVSPLVRPAGMSLLGWVAPTPDRPDADGVIGIYSVFVDTWARGCGVGDALLAAAIGQARAAGARRVVLDVGDRNPPAQALYRRAGFSPTGRTGSLPPPRQHVTEHELALDLR